MSHQAVQTNLISNLTKHFGTGNPIIDCIVTIFVSTILFKMFELFNIKYLKIMYTWLYNKIRRKYVYTIEYKCILGEKGCIEDKDSKRNKILINGIELYVTEHGKDSKNYKCKLSEDDGSDNTYKRMLTRKLIYLPEYTKLKKPYDDIEVYFERDEENIKEKCGSIQIIVTIESRKSKDSVNDFLKTCYQKYIDHKYSKDKDSTGKLYFYAMTSIEWSTFHEVAWYKYIRCNNKCFDDIFFPEKNKVKMLLDKFQNKQFNKKMSLLLYGPPGTGKTSLIKIISNYTNRHIFYVKLSEVMTFEDLFHIFFGEKIQEKFTDSNSTTYNVGVKERIIILEDIDVETKSCHNREEQSNNNNDKDKDNKSFKKTLNLSDLLQIFDGIYECEDLMFIITTNNINKLDPALVRPGRITLKLKMDKLIKTCALDMIKYYFKSLDDRFNIIKDHTITPAELEYMCKESCDINELYDKLVDHYK